ncbi:hypothetical protein DJFAAGMI_00361 [Comamonas sp. PE63]|uniref:HTH araC/xylS-type domain-containing protein n=1 Tax=Comamonas brasiliensis TaxID=1812482 RepID=A0ABS5LMD0_9BURK|nr:AraC family transcriptional regulator [Comamonas sp. PE63]MBS3017638.1 hypothetical protein [Comamonas sp. PE63]
MNLSPIKAPQVPKVILVHQSTANPLPSEAIRKPQAHDGQYENDSLVKKNWLSRTDAMHGIERIEAFFQGNAYCMHRHDTYAIGCTMAGVQAFRYRGAHRQSLPGHTMVLHPDEAHDGQAGTDDGFHYRMIYVNPALIQEVLGGLELPYIEGGITQSQRLLVAAKTMLDNQHGPTNSMEETDAIVELALALHAEAGCTRGQRARDFQSTKLAHDFLCDVWQSTVSMEDLGVVTGRDRWSLSRDFRMFYGTSPSRFLILRKLDVARQRMLSGASLADAAASTGFADQAHMTRHFTQTFGISPGRWLRMMRFHKSAPSGAQTFKI